jgi:endonuclease/exonuclease/phosphatase family metal-dependent hydrolase
LIRLIKKLLFSFNVVAILLLLSSYLSVYINPKDLWYIALLGLSYPFILFLNILFVILWAFLLNYKAVYGILAIAIGFNFIERNFQFSNANKAIETDSLITIASYNVGLFGYFSSKWYLKETIEKVNETKPDILCIQEFLNIKEQNTNTLELFLNETKYKYHYFEKLNDGRKVGEYGMAIFSNYPILKSELVQFNVYTGNMCVYSDIKINDSVYRFYNVHLQSFRFRKTDYDFVNTISEKNKEPIEKSKNILKKIKHAYTTRAEQVSDLLVHQSEIELPTFVVGDFNDPPVSYAYQKLAKNHKDAFNENGEGMGKTYVGLMPNFRIDYLLYPKVFKGHYYQSFKLSSDHRMIVTKISISE